MVNEWDESSSRDGISRVARSVLFGFRVRVGMGEELTLLIPGARGKDQTSGICVVAFFRPFGTWECPYGYPQLALWAAFFRRFAAGLVPIFRRLFGRLFSLASTAADSSLALRASSDERDLPGGRVQPRLALAGQPRRMSLRGSWGGLHVAGW